LDTGQLVERLRAGGKQADLIEGVDAIVSHVAKGARGGDVVCVFSNGGFGGIHEKLLARLGS
jgi:UDP-N-acetylmuramate: L-alanyl-gamma-D-glutamyl-meso-diaminopimelate ligase